MEVSVKFINTNAFHLINVRTCNEYIINVYVKLANTNVLHLLNIRTSVSFWIFWIFITLCYLIQQSSLDLRVNIQ